MGVSSSCVGVRQHMGASTPTLSYNSPPMLPRFAGCVVLITIIEWRVHYVHKYVPTSFQLQCPVTHRDIGKRNFEPVSKFSNDKRNSTVLK